MASYQAGSLVFEPKEHVYSVNGIVVPSVTQILAATGLSDYSFLPPDKAEYCRRRGTFVHAAARQIVEGRFNRANLEKYPQVAGFILAFEAFLVGEQFETLATECGVILASGSCAGTLDLLGKRGGKNGVLSLADLKTGMAPKSTGLQTAAYENGLRSLAGQYEFCIEPHARMSVELRKDGTYRVRGYDDPDDYGKFLTLLEAYKIKREFGVRMEEAA